MSHSLPLPISSDHALPRGFIPVMLTPFCDNGTVDWKGLAYLTDFYLETGAAGLFANCLSSEMYELTEAERLAVTQQVVRQVAGRAPVVATGTFQGTIDQQADFVKRIYDTGVQAVIITTNQLVRQDESDAVLLERFHRLLDLTEKIPVGMYECPVPYKRLINSTILTELLPTKRLIYLKDTSLDAAEVARRLEAGKGYTFGLYDAYLVNAVSSLQAGAAGLSCIQGNIFPELISWVCAHVHQPARREEVMRLQRFFTECMDLVHTAYPTIAKYSLQKRGLPVSLYTRRQVESLTPVLRKAIDDLMDSAAQLCEELHIELASASL
ncbi:dihydrodipicolinate synthase family protein [Spirosoma fluminis]